MEDLIHVQFDKNKIGSIFHESFEQIVWVMNEKFCLYFI